MAAFSGCSLSSATISRLFYFPRSKHPARVTIRKSGVTTHPDQQTIASNSEAQRRRRYGYGWESDKEEEGGLTLTLTLKDYFQQSKEMLRYDGGPPRWFSPLECASPSRLQHSPLLLFLPGIDGVGLGLLPHHKKLGEIFDVWCLHIPLSDQSSFTDLVKLVEETVRLEYCNAPKRPIYLIGESFGSCIALAVAARNPDIDLVLILANPATCFSRSWLQNLLTLADVMPELHHPNMIYMLSLISV